MLSFFVQLLYLIKSVLLVMHSLPLGCSRIYVTFVRATLLIRLESKLVKFPRLESIFWMAT